MSDDEFQALRSAFYMSFETLVAHGDIPRPTDRGDTIERLFQRFIQDLSTGFESVFPATRMTEQ